VSLVLTLEHAPQPQAVRQMRLERGTLVIGRAPEADWRIDDPDMFVSRAHCTVAAVPSGYTVTDTSSGGLFIDGGRTPLGAGNSAVLRDGMRLRIGDYVVRVELAAAAEAGHAASRQPGAAPTAPGALGADDFFAAPLDTPRPEPRPAGLPDPFERPISTPRMEETRAQPPLFDDPFTLDPAPARTVEPATFGGFDWDAPAPEPVPAAPPPDVAASHARPRDPTPPAGRPAEGGRAAFLRGLGLDPADFPADDPDAEMEALGRAHRLMIEGLMHLLHKRAEEKAGARIALTVVGGSEVNPLKFLPTADAALATMLARRPPPGFLGQEAAVSGAIRDLAQHHVSAWRGVQGALARMLDRFDPAAIEAELKGLGLLGTLLAGGRRAKLWELYEERYREIARSAETRFLGEVGADFRDAYENKGG
jgi:type VI secretion system protein ImpI